MIKFIFFAEKNGEMMRELSHDQTGKAQPKVTNIAEEKANVEKASKIADEEAKKDEYVCSNDHVLKHQTATDYLD